MNDTLKKFQYSSVNLKHFPSPVSHMLTPEKIQLASQDSLRQVNGNYVFQISRHSRRLKLAQVAKTATNQTDCVNLAQLTSPNLSKKAHRLKEQWKHNHKHFEAMLGHEMSKVSTQKKFTKDTLRETLYGK